MNYDKILVVGGNSSIAGFVMPTLNFDKNILYSIVRSKKKSNENWVSPNNIFVSDFPISRESLTQMHELLAPNKIERILILNFVGVYGKPQPIEILKTQDVLEVINENLGLFINLVKFIFELPRESILISFSGAGVGGDNMDVSSPGYLASKIATAALVETLDEQLRKKNKSRIALVAPGPFPSKMQLEVLDANPGFVSDAARKVAQNVTVTDGKIEKLSEAIKWISNNPETSGGKIWSAIHDDFSNSNFSINYGLLRRQIHQD